MKIKILKLRCLITGGKQHLMTRRGGGRARVKMISAQHSSNNGKNYVTKRARTCSIVTFKLVGRSYRDLSSQDDPTREN